MFSTVGSSAKMASAASHRSTISLGLRMKDRSAGAFHVLGLRSSCRTLLCTPWKDTLLLRTGVVSPNCSKLPALTLLPSFSNWSMLSCRTRPPSAPSDSESAATTTARWWSRTSVAGVLRLLPPGGYRGGTPLPLRPSGVAAFSKSDSLSSRHWRFWAILLPWISMAAAASAWAASISAVAPDASLQLRPDSHRFQGFELASANSGLVWSESYDTSISSSRSPPLSPPYTKTTDPTAATACRHLLSESPAARTSSSVIVDHTPLVVSSSETESLYPTSLFPPSAPPMTCILPPTKTAPCWYLGEEAIPGAGVHSHLPSRCLTRPWASAIGVFVSSLPPIRRSRPSCLVVVVAYILAEGAGPDEPDGASILRHW
mmetsp:Transcript_4892/g.14828  ORF Transcript_4892/g.14828 Transcript_4892/m.14828 type:complete len:373 (-) Transcript_4892:61-1179(-)